MSGPFFLGEITLTLKRSSVEMLRELTGREQIIRRDVAALHSLLCDELAKTEDDIQHEKLEAATRAAQTMELNHRASTTTIVNNTVVPADIHVQGDGVDSGRTAMFEPLNDDLIERLKDLGFTNDVWEMQGNGPIEKHSDPVDGNDPDDIARAVYELMCRDGVPFTPARRLLFCREIVALVRSHLPEDQPQPAKGKVLLEISHHTAAYIKRMAEDRVERYPFRLPFTEALIMEIEAALGEKS